MALLQAEYQPIHRPIYSSIANGKGGGIFNPASVGNLQQFLFNKTALSGSTVFDESTNKGDARDVQLRQFRKLNGADEYGNIPDNPNLDITNNLSVITWVKNDDLLVTGSEFLISKYNSVADMREWAVRALDDAGDTILSILFGDPADGTFEAEWQTNSPVALNTVKTVGFSFTSGTLVVYVDGVVVAGTVVSGAIPSSLYNGTSSLQIGASVNLNLWDGDIYEARIYDTTILTGDDFLGLTNNPITYIPAARCVAFYKLDNNVTEEIIDSSGYGNDGVWVNSPTKSTGGAVHSWANDVGYTLGTGSNGYASGVFIPRDESDILFDVAGNPLEFKGRAPNNGLLKQSNCISFDGIDQYITVSGMTAAANYFGACTISARIRVDDDAASSVIWALGADAYRLLFAGGTWRLNQITDTGVAVTEGEQTVSVTYNAAGSAISFSIDGVEVWTGNSGTATAATTVFYIGARDLSGIGLFFDGAVYDFAITGSSVKNFAFNMAEGAGTLVYDKTGGGNNGVLVNDPTRDKQDNFHSNITDGCSRYMHFDGVDDGVDLASNITYSGDFSIRFKGVATDLTSGVHLSANDEPSAGRGRFLIDSAGRVGVTSDDETLVVTSAGFISANDIFDLVISRSGSTITITDNKSGNTENITLGKVITINTIGKKRGAFTSVDAFIGVLHDVDLDSAAYQGYGNTDANWVDLIGSNDGTVVGTPTNIYIPAQSETLDVFGEALKNPAGIYHNGAETLIDFTGGVASPEAVTNSWETAWAFNTARTNPEFKRTITLDSVDYRADRFLAYEETLSGTDLTKVQNFTATEAL